MSAATLRPARLSGSSKVAHNTKTALRAPQSGSKRMRVAAAAANTSEVILGFRLFCVDILDKYCSAGMKESPQFAPKPARSFRRCLSLRP